MVYLEAKTPHDLAMRWGYECGRDRVTPPVMIAEKWQFNFFLGWFVRGKPREVNCSDMIKAQDWSYNALVLRYCRVFILLSRLRFAMI